MRSFFNSFQYAFQGIRWALQQRNMRIHFLAAILVIIAGFYFTLSAVEWCIVCICITSVMAAECLNSSIEEIANFIHPEKHEKIKRIKDLSAAAVLLCAITSLIIARIIFVPKIYSE